MRGKAEFAVKLFFSLGKPNCREILARAATFAFAFAGSPLSLADLGSHYLMGAAARAIALPYVADLAPRAMVDGELFASVLTGIPGMRTSVMPFAA